MKREIKFRVWHTVDYMSGVFTLDDVVKGYVKFTDECIVMQFTGLKNKNGVEIYEGDIISNFQAEENEVYWHESGGWYMCNHHASALLLSDYSSVSEVIGNIYESK